MSQLLDKIIEAKDKLGDKQAEIIAEGYPLEQWNPERGSAKSIFNPNDNTPSMMWEKRNYYFKDFSTGKVFGILDYYMQHYNEPYLKAVKRLLDETNTEYEPSLFNFSQTSESKDYFRNYIYPHEEPPANDAVIAYMAKRGISEKTCRYVGLGSDIHNNVAYNVRDINGKLTVVKYRPSHAIRQGEAKYFYQKNASVAPVLYNVDKVDPTKPLVVTEGYCFTGDAQVLTKNGWVNLKDYDDEEVLQVNEDGTSSFVMPIAKVKHHYEGNLVEINRGGNYYSLTTDDHKIVLRNKKTNELVKREVGNLPDTLSSRYEIPCTTSYMSGSGVGLSDAWIRLEVAFSADGCVTNGECYRKRGVNRVRFFFAKKRKFDRLKWILDELGIKYTQTVRDYKLYADGIIYYIGFTDEDNVLTKIFNNDWIHKMTPHQREVFIEELQYWDGGSFKNRTMTEYYSCEPKNVEFVQTICHLSGIMATIVHREIDYNNCTVHILNNKDHVTWQKMWSNGQARKVPYNGEVYCLQVPSGMLLVRQHEHISVSGNCDCLACIEAGFVNVVSIPSGAEDLNWVELNFELLDQCEEIILWYDNDEAGQEGLKKVIQRLGEYRCKIVKPTEEDEEAVRSYYQNVTNNSSLDIHKTDANNVLLACGAARILSLINNAEEIPLESVIDLMTAEPFDIGKVNYIPTGIADLDRQVYGYIDGTFSIFTAYAGCGKTTLLSQSCVLEAVDKGESVFWFNSESSTASMLSWILQQAASRKHCVEYTNQNGFKYYKPTPQATEAIKKAYSKKIFVYDNLLLSNPEQVLDKMKAIYRKRGTKVFIIDNWMCLNFRGISEQDIAGAQVEFLNKLIHFTKQNGLEVSVVCHPKKPSAVEPLNQYSLLGSSNITNLADRIYGLEKIISPELRDRNYDRQITVFKDRILGVQGAKVGLHYDRVTRRLYSDSDNRDKRYSWDDGSIRYSSPNFGSNGLLVGDRVLDIDRQAEDNVPY